MYQDQDLWELMKAFFREKGLVRQHLDSYDEFIEKGLTEIIDDIGVVEIPSAESPLQIRFGHIHMGSPRVVEVDGSEHDVYPMECRLRNLTYAAPLYLEMTMTSADREIKTEAAYIGDLPVMLKSSKCPLSEMRPEELRRIKEDPEDPGGYFIINGSERVIVGLEDLAPNKIIVDVDRSGSSPVYRAKVFSTTIGFRTRVEVRMKPDGAIYVTIPGVPTELPLLVLMRALNVERDDRLVEMVSPLPEVQKWIEPSLEKAQGIYTAEQAMMYVGNRVAFGQDEQRRREKANSIIDRNFLLHLGRTAETRHDKARYLAEIVNRLIELKLGLREADDKDHYANKRIRLAGPLLADLFRAVFRDLIKDMTYQLERINRRRGVVPELAVRPGIITERIQHALATGNWGRGKVGVTQLLDRTNFTSTLSHLRRLQSPLSRSQPNFEARDLHSTHFGRLCPSETPEGSNCGLVKNLALMSCISTPVNPEEVKQVLVRLGSVPLKDADPEVRVNGAKVFLDGALFGYTATPEALLATMRSMRRRREISSELNVAYYRSEREVHVNGDAGRCRRPLIIVQNGLPALSLDMIERVKAEVMSFEELVELGAVEYLDAEEEENAYIALTEVELSPETTHLEICPYTMLGICASIIPYAEHNHAPRNTYESAMAKQALGVYATNYAHRADTRGHLLHYPQKPLVRTKPMDVVGYDSRPSGQNCVVAVVSYAGYNMEDALVFNRSSIERGLGRSMFFRLYEAECRQYMGGQKDVFELPDPTIRGYRGEHFYRLLEPDGITSVESDLSGGDVLVGRTSPPRFLEEYKEFEIRGPSRRDTSVPLRPSEVGVADSVLVTETSQGGKLVKIKVRDNRVPEIGDKFASRHGQKGVIGMVYPQEDMPFTEQGVVPDLVINPHAIPSRMTVGQLLECLAGKAAALQGKPVDGTPFSNAKEEDLKRVLLRYGFRPSGREVMYNGMTGDKLGVDLYVGLVYYQKLHHMVADKIHARARGQVQMLTRQPTEGRARGGGLRFGEMERDCLIGHGAAMLLKDRMLEESDKFTAYVCDRCGYLAYYDLRQRSYTCPICREEARIEPLVMSYAFKLLVQELMSMCISPRILLEERV